MVATVGNEDAVDRSNWFVHKKKKGDVTVGGGRPIPVVIISALRPHYLLQVLESLQRQNPNTPAEILHSPRYLLVHRHVHNDIGDPVQSDGTGSNEVQLYGPYL
jgi:hypothetical protein